MAIVIQCPNPACAASASVSDAFEGRGVKCRKCGTPFKATATLDGQPADTKRSSPSSAGEPFASLPAEFGRYRVLRLLGRGGMGAVYLADDSQLGRPVALKLPHFDASETRRVERFVREAKSAAGLMHPNICPVFDAGQVNGRPFITMAYIDGKSLEALIAPDEPMDPRRAAEVTRTLAAALHEAHERGIVHRDLKPANVMVNAKGEPVVMDFGLAKRVAEADPNEAKLTRDGAVMGTPGYMAPEQVKGELDRIGPATDVYALGVMLFEMLTGHTPYTGPLGVVMGQILGAPVRGPSELRGGLDPRLDAACRRAMAKDPADRFPDMPAFGLALGEYLQGPAADASPPAPTPFEVMVADASPAEPPAPRAARRKAVTVPPPERTRPPLWPFAVGAGLLGMLAVAVALAAVVLTVRTRYGDVVIDLGDAAAGVEVKIDGERVELGGLDKPLTLTAGEHGLTVAGGDFETVTQQFTVKKGEKQVVKVTLKPKPAAQGEPAVQPLLEKPSTISPKTPALPTADAASALDALNPSFIPDAILAKLYGSRAAAPPELVTVYDTGRPDSEGYHGMDISPDGRLVATSKFPLKVVYVRDLATGQPVHRFALPPSKPFAYWLKFSPDGKTLYGVQHEFLLHAWDMEGRELWSAPARSDWSDPALSPDGATLITAADGGGIQVLDAKTGAVRSRWPEAVSAGCRLIYSRDGGRIAAATGRGVRVIDPKDGSVTKTIGLDSAATEPAFSRDGTKVYTSHVWKVGREHVNESDIETETVREYCHGAKGSRNPQVHPAAPLLATVSSDGSVQFWDLTAGPEQLPLSIPLGGGIHRCLFTPDGRHAVAVASSGVFVLRIPLDEGVPTWIARRTGRAAKPPATAQVPPAAAEADRAKPPADAVSLGGSAFKVYPDHLSWKAAKARCAEFGGRLAVVDSEERNRLASRLIDAAGLKEAWFGATDEAEEGVWRWVDGRAVTYTNWHAGQPNNKGGVEHYALIWHGSDREFLATGPWCDQPDTAQSLHKPGFVCEWPAASGFTPLFNGKNLEGWKALPAFWKVQGDTVVGRQRADAPLLTSLLLDKSLGDFQVRLQVRFPDGGSASLRFRNDLSKESELIVRGPGVGLGDGQWGDLYYPPAEGTKFEIKPVGEAVRARLVRKGEFNEVGLTAIGKRLTVTLNGEVTASGVFPTLPDRGLFGLRLSNDSAAKSVEVQSVEIAAVPAAPATPKGDDGSGRVEGLPDMAKARSVLCDGGKTLYWAAYSPQNPVPEVWRATRRSAGEPFTDAAKFTDGFHFAADERDQSVVLTRRLGSSVNFEFLAATKTAGASQPGPFSPVANLSQLRSATFSANGSTLYGTTALPGEPSLPVRAKRSDPKDPRGWGKPEPVSVPDFSPGVWTWTSVAVSPDERHLVAAVAPFHRVTRESTVVVLSSDDGGKSYKSPRVVRLPSGSANASHPFYSPATNELYYSAPVGPDKSDLHVIRNFRPESCTAPLVMAEADDVTKQAGKWVPFVESGRAVAPESGRLNVWQKQGSEAAFADGVLLLKGGGLGVRAGFRATNYVVRANVKFDRPGAGGEYANLGLQARYCNLTFKQTPDPTTGLFTLARLVDGKPTELVAAQRVKLNADGSADMALAVKGGAVVAFVGGRELHRVSGLPPVESLAALECGESRGVFRRPRLMILDGTALTVDDALKLP